tara:strand:+ start:6556 stop:7650 length:1095 start_codon:yes stop_codon:yes gene_type:complete
MNVCLIGNGISTLILAMTLANRGIKVLICEKDNSKKKTITRTLGISKDSLNFLMKEKINLKKNSWPIDRIKIFNEIKNNGEILNFGSNKHKIFSIIKYNDLIKFLYISIKKNKLIKKMKIKDSSFYNSILKEKNSFDLIFNFDEKNKISKNFFYKRIEKDYNSIAFTSLIHHLPCKNYTAQQIFTKIGPLAFLPCSKNKTSIVFSIFDKNNILTESKIKELIISYNKKYKIKSFSKFEKFKLKSSILKNYYYKNILCFGDILHKIHPLAGQGLNMTIRDIKILLNLIDFKINLGLPLDNSIFVEFQKKAKHLNYIFSGAIDFIHEFFKFDNNYGKIYSKKLFSLLESNSSFKSYTTKFADKGFF